MMFLNRRDFLQQSAALAALAAGSSAMRADEGSEPKKKKGDANDTLHVAVIGVNGRGMSHVGGFNNKLNCVITHICDVDTAVIGRAMRAVEDSQGKAPKFEQDLRRIMDDKSIDIVTIATPNHWHALAAIWALQAGKDVYVEKPVSHNVTEGRRIVETARKFNRICQTGTQSRSSTGLQEAMAFLHSGGIGKVKLARGLCYKLRPSIGKTTGEQPIPKTIDYNLWCGPAPMKPLARKRLHYDWHWMWDYGNGDLGNQGIHEMDKARWGLGKNELAKAVLSVGGRYGYEDDGETANTQICWFDYGDCELIFEVRGLPSVSPYPSYFEQKKREANHVGNIWYGTDGIMVCGNYSGATAFSPKGEVIKKFSGGENHFGNFVKAVRSRKSSDLNADILEGHLSSALCHLGNISYRLGTPQDFTKSKDAFGGRKDGEEALGKMCEHLRTNNVKLELSQCRVGRMLQVDPKAETFISDVEADAMLTRKYREPFVVPAKV